MARLTSNQELDVWIKTRELVRDIYELTKSFPKEEQFGLINQLRRAAVSVPSNSAEGCGRNHFRDSIQRFYISRGSLYEIETQILICFDLGYLDKEKTDTTIKSISICKRLLNGFINYYQSRSDEQPTTINEQPEQEYGSSNKD